MHNDAKPIECHNIRLMEQGIGGNLWTEQCVCVVFYTSHMGSYEQSVGACLFEIQVAFPVLTVHIKPYGLCEIVVQHQVSFCD